MKHSKKSVPAKILSSAQLSLILTFAFTCVGLVGFYWHNQQIQSTNPAPSRVKSTQLQKVDQPNIFFYTQSFGDLKKVFISLPYTFENEPHLMWLNFQPKPGIPVRNFLVSHPQLHNLDWPSLTNPDQSITLFQKTAKFDSVEAFLQQIPEKGIAADPDMIITHHLPDTTSSLDQSLDLNQIDYILTTYRPSRYDNNRYYYETTIDASTAALNEKEELVWFLKVPSATQDHPIHIGEIHIDYRL